MARRKPSDEVVEATPTGASAQAVPDAVRVLRTYGFVDEHGDTWHWSAGAVVRNPYVVGMLRDRGAPVEDAA